MKSIPTEVLVNILNRPPFSNQLTCLYVSKAWRKVALSCFEGAITLNGDNKISQLSQVLQDAETNGSDYNGFGTLVKKLIIYGEGRTRDTCDKFVRLLERFPNLNEIEFCDHPLKFLRFMDKANIPLDALHFIKVNKYYMADVAAVYVSVISKYAASVERIRFRVVDENRLIRFSAPIIDQPFGGPVRHHIGPYLHKFSHLNNLSIMLTEEVDPMPILESTPNLTSLALKGSFPILVNSPGLKVYSCLITLKIGIDSFSKDLCHFIAYNLTSLQTLKICSAAVDYWNPFRDRSVLMDAFDEFCESKGGKAPTVKVLSLDNLHRLRSDFVNMIPTWFRNLRELRFKNCTFGGIWDSEYNIKLGLQEADLDLLSIDVTEVLQKSERIENLCFEITLMNGGEENTVFYFRESEKWSPQPLFERRTGDSLINSSSASRRKSSLSVAVIYITISSLEKLHVYSPNLFSQMLDVQ